MFYLQSMHLVYKALEKEPVPTTLPIALIPPSKRKNNPIPGGIQVLPGAVPVLPMMGGRSTPTQRSDSPSVSLLCKLCCSCGGW